MILIVLAFIALLGAWVIYIGIRGKAIDDHPLCRRCGFDLTGKPDGSTACAECGTDLLAERAVRIGHRQRGVRWITAGVLLLALALAATSLVAVERSQPDQWLKYAPVKWLLWSAQHSDPAAQSAAVKELYARATGGKLSASQMSCTIDVALGRQGNLAVPWDSACGNLIESARTGRRLTDQQWETYARQATQGAMTLRVRPNLRLGDALPYWIEQNGWRTANPTILRFTFDAIRPTIDNAAVDLSRRDLVVTARKPSEGEGDGSYVNAEELPRNLGYGLHQLFVPVLLDAATPADPSHVLPVVFNKPFTLLPASQPSVRAVADPAMGDAIRNSLKVDMEVSARGNGFSSRSEVTVDGTPVALSFDVFVVIDGKEYPAFSFACPAGTKAYTWSLRLQAPLQSLVIPGATTRPHGSVIGHATVLFRSDPAPAIESVDTFDYWDGTIVFKDVPILQD
jgi:hypothetical protein